MNRNYSNLTALLAITKASLKASLRNPSTLVFGFLFPFIFIVIFGLIGSGKAVLNVGVATGTDTNNPVYQFLKDADTIKLTTPEDKNDADQLADLKKGKLDGIISIQKDPQGRVIIDLQTTNASQNSPLLAGTLQGIAANMNVQVLPQQSLPVQLNTPVEVKGREFTNIDFVLPGQLGFSLLSSGIFATAFVFINLKQTLVIKRFFATPVKRSVIVMGEGLSRLIFALFQATVIIGVGTLLFHYTLINGLVTLIAMLMLSAIGLIVFLGIGFMVSSIAKDENAVPPLANLFTLPQFLLAGTFFPIDLFPTWLQGVARLMPLFYLNDAMRKVAFEGAGIGAIATDLLALLIWGVIIYVITIKIFKWE
jgi:ABC-2 type transport system permease protein